MVITTRQNCKSCGLPLDGTGAMHFDCAVDAVAEWRARHSQCVHPKMCKFVKDKKGKKQHA